MPPASQVTTRDGQLTPRELFAAFATGSYRSSVAALAQLERVKQKGPFLQPALRFVTEAQVDTIRSWGMSTLAVIGGNRAFEALLTVFETPVSNDDKRTFRYTRFFALRGLEKCASTPEQRAKLDALLEQLWVNPWQNATEDYLVQAEAAVLLALRGRADALKQIQAMIRLARQDFWIAWAACRALEEFPLREVLEDLLQLARSGFYLEHRARAVRALGTYRGDEIVVGEISRVARNDPDPYLRLIAVMSLGRLGNVGAKDALLKALFDEDAEIRVQATAVLSELLSPATAVREIVQRALSGETPKDSWEHLYDALRRIDVERIISVEILNKELGGEDRLRAEAAEEILLNLGGWAAMHRLSQRRSTLQTLDNILSESEQVVRSTFEETIKQARRNFYFAMSVNVLVVTIGLALITIAIVQLARDPSKLESWILPGGSGVLGIVINGWFNNPRKHAREDLRTLLNVNVIFLGFLRQLNQIDATFKHAYIEGLNFGADEMQLTVQQIDTTVERTLRMAAGHLTTAQPEAAEEKPEAAPETGMALAH
jgi:HEAT repeat protein